MQENLVREWDKLGWLLVWVGLVRVWFEIWASYCYRYDKNGWLRAERALLSLIGSHSLIHNSDLSAALVEPLGRAWSSDQDGTQARPSSPSYVCAVTRWFFLGCLESDWCPQTALPISKPQLQQILYTFYIFGINGTISVIKKVLFLRIFSIQHQKSFL